MDWFKLQLARRMARSADAGKRRMAADRLGAIRRPESVSVLAVLAADAEREVRAAAVCSLGATGMPDGIPVAARLLTADDEVVSQGAATSFAELFRSLSPESLAGQIDRVYREAGAEQRRVLEKVLAESKPSVGGNLVRCYPHCAEVTRSAINAFFKRSHEAFLPDLAEGAKADVREVAGVAVGLLAEIGTGTAVEVLKNAFRHAADGEVRTSAAQALRRAGWLPTSVDEQVDLAVAALDWDLAASLGTAALPALLKVVHTEAGDLKDGAVDTVPSLGESSSSREVVRNRVESFGVDVKLIGGLGLGSPLVYAGKFEREAHSALSGAMSRMVGKVVETLTRHSIITVPLLREMATDEAEERETRGYAEQLLARISNLELRLQHGTRSLLLNATTLPRKAGHDGIRRGPVACSCRPVSPSRCCSANWSHTPPTLLPQRPDFLPEREGPNHPAQVAPRSDAACRRTACGSDGLRPAAASNTARA